MNTFRKTFLTLSAITILGTAIAQNKDPVIELVQQNSKALTGEISTNLINNNMFYMMNFNKTPMIQPSLFISYKGLSVGTWSNYDIANTQFAEHDWVINYTIPMKFDSTHALNITLGIANYSFPNSNMVDVQQTEINLSSKGFLFDASAKFAKAYNSGGQGWLFKAAVSKSVSLSNKISASLASSITYNQEYFSTATGWAGIDGSFSLNWKPVKNLNITAMVTGQKGLDKDFSEDNLGSSGSIKDQAYFSTTVSWSLEN